jgi:hypothetical protein
MTNTDPIRFEALAQHYRSEADICLEMAEQADGALRKELVRTAARWIELAQEAEAHRRPN